MQGTQEKAILSGAQRHRRFKKRKRARNEGLPDTFYFTAEDYPAGILPEEPIEQEPGVVVVIPEPVEPADTEPVSPWPGVFRYALFLFGAFLLYRWLFAPVRAAMYHRSEG